MKILPTISIVLFCFSSLTAFVAGSDTEGSELLLLSREEGDHKYSSVDCVCDLVSLVVPVSPLITCLALVMYSLATGNMPFLYVSLAFSAIAAVLGKIMCNSPEIRDAMQRITD